MGTIRLHKSEEIERLVSCRLSFEFENSTNSMVASYG
jgi:hypothetical protein